jgi:hypothetical protein
MSVPELKHEIKALETHNAFMKSDEVTEDAAEDVAKIAKEIRK